MAPSSYKKKSGRSTRAEKRPNAVSGDKPANRRRLEHDVIDGIDIFSFENELNLQYFTNLEEPVPRKTRRFRGFDENDYEAASLKQIKSRFDLFIKQNNENVSENHNESVEVSQCAEASSAVLRVAEDLIVLSDDESSLGPTAVSQTTAVSQPTAVPQPTAVSQPAAVSQLPAVSLPTAVSQPTSVSNGKPVHISQPAEVITIESDDDSDDDVVMISDPNAPLPQPVRDCVCPHCGKVKRTEQNRRVAASDRDSGVDDLSIITDDVAIITDEEEPVVSAPIHNTPLQPKEVPAQSAYIRQEVPVQPAEVLTEEVSSLTATGVPSEVPSPAAGEPQNVSISRPLNVNNASSLGDQQLPSSLSPARQHHISAKPSNNMCLDVQKPSGQLEPPATMPKTICVVSKGSGKTFYLTINGAKSKILKPLTSPSNKCNSTEQPQSFHYLHPSEKPCGVSSSQATTIMQVEEPTPKSVVGPRTVEVVKMQQPNLTPKPVVGPLKPEVGKIEQPNGVPHTYHRVTIPSNTIRVTLPPGFSDKNKVIKAQPTDGAKVQVQVVNSIIAKPGVSIALGSFPQTGQVIVPPQSQLKQQSINDINKPITEATSEPLVLEDDTKSVVVDLIDFVCRQENFPTSFPYDQERTEQLSIDVPCRQLRCRMGCLCVSLAKKNVRRVRCKNVRCIFGCVCMSHGVVVPPNRYAKTMPNMKVPGISRRKQVLTVLPDCDAASHRIGLKSFLPVQKVAGVSRYGNVRSSSVGQESARRYLVPGAHSMHQDSGFGTSTQPASKDLQFPVNVSISKTNVASSLRHHPTSDLAPAKELLAPPDNPTTGAASQDPASRLSVPVVQPRSFFGREKTPIPERALMCLTPGFGYVPLSEIHPTVTLDSPFKPGSSKSFLSIRQATEWLNAKLKNHLTDKMPPSIRWVVADGQTIERKQQHRLSVAQLSSPNCTISRNGAVFLS